MDLKAELISLRFLFTASYLGSELSTVLNAKVCSNLPLGLLTEENWIGLAGSPFIEFSLYPKYY